MKMKPKLTRTGMSQRELTTYHNWTKKSGHVFKNRKKYDRKRKAVDTERF